VAFIDYLSSDRIPAADRIPDDDNILRIHSVHSRLMRLHYELYLETMHRQSPLSRLQREMIAVVVSSNNGCEY
jgi:alkylhydroperoxidase family enzyme